MRRVIRPLCWFLPFLALVAATAEAQVLAIRAGRLVDPETGTVAANQVILVAKGKFAAVGADVQIPAGAELIDLSKLTVLPGLVDTHNHLALTYKDEPESNVYYLTYVLDSTPLRAIQAVSNGIQMLASGFTIVRDMGNNGNYADTALRVGIEQGWVPGPTITRSCTPSTSTPTRPTRSSRPCARTCCSARRSSRSASTASPGATRWTRSSWR
jgi:imidazolonepropionase-like amidohydrolase